MKLNRRIGCALSSLLAVPFLTNAALAANRAGDANNDKAISMADAALVQSRLYGLVASSAVSPLALVGVDGSLGVDDLMRLGQIATSTLSGVSTRPALLTVTPPAGQTYAAGATASRTFPVLSNYADATMVNGLDALAFSILEGVAVASTHSAPASVVASGTAGVTLNASNPGGSPETVTSQLTVSVLPSTGFTATPYSGQVADTVNPTGTCGNGIINVNFGEDCDDGNTVSGDGCEANCQLVCGPPASGGHRAKVDGVSGNCLISFMSTATYAQAQTNCRQIGGYLVVPGSGAEDALAYSLVPVDQNTYIGLNDLGFEAFTNPILFATDNGRGTGGYFGFAPGEPSTSSSTDDCVAMWFGQQWNDVDCATPRAYICELEPNPCGDNVLQTSSGEVCDDGNTDSNDDCTALCAPNTCGDGHRDQQGPVTEQCDDANTNDCDACSNTCRNVLGCGDGVLCGAEICDDGNTSSLDDCTENCTPNVCGDGFQDQMGPVTEACDDGDMDNCDACSNICTVVTGCGDGAVCGAEACDDGNGSNTDDCRTTCVLNVCGDGFQDQQGPVTEGCDDGNGSNTDDCLTTCVPNSCGDGFQDLQAPVIEACDDGNGNSQDDCTNACMSNVCGDGHQDLQGPVVEACDDGNTNACDGCSFLCVVEFGCGDGSVCGAEACDDANSNDNDYCKNNCTLNVCGDGVVRTGFEECDDGNLSNTDNCTNACLLPVCGDTYVDSQTPGIEQCEWAPYVSYAVNRSGGTQPAQQVKAMFIRGGVAYLAQGSAGLVTVDIQTSPFTQLDVAGAGQDYVDITVHGDIAYVCSRSAGSVLYGFNVANPSNIQNPSGWSSVVVSAFNDRCEAVMANGGRLYVAAGNDGLRVYDIARPDLAPTLLASPNPGGTIRDVFVQNNRLIATGSSTSYVYDISADTPALLGSTSMSNGQAGWATVDLTGAGIGQGMRNPGNTTKFSFTAGGAITNLGTAGASSNDLFLSGDRLYNLSGLSADGGPFIGNYVGGGPYTSITLFDDGIYGGGAGILERRPAYELCTTDCVGADTCGNGVIGPVETCDPGLSGSNPMVPCSSRCDAGCYNPPSGLTGWITYPGAADQVAGTGGYAWAGDDIASAPGFSGNGFQFGTPTAAETDDVIWLEPYMLDGLGDFSVSFWVNTTDNNCALVSGANATQSNEFLVYLLSSGNLDIWLKGSLYTVLLPTELPYPLWEGRWHQIVVTRSGTTLSAYVDSRLVRSFAGVSAVAMDIDDIAGIQSGLLIGQDQDSLGGGFDAAQTLNTGTVDEIQFFNRALGATEVRELHTRAMRYKDGVWQCLARCGDGYVQASEVCDDANNINTDDECGNACNGTPGGNCCSTGHGTGCQYSFIQDCVCNTIGDDYCCTTNWDSICAGEAAAAPCNAICP